MVRQCQTVFEFKKDLGSFGFSYENTRWTEHAIAYIAIKFISEGRFGELTEEQRANFITLWLALHDEADPIKPIANAKAELSGDDKEKKATAEKNLDDFIEALKKVKP